MSPKKPSGSKRRRAKNRGDLLQRSFRATPAQIDLIDRAIKAQPLSGDAWKTNVLVQAAKRLLKISKNTIIE